MPVDFVALANAGIQKLHPYEPGKPIEELERELGITDILKLASNESPVGASPKAMAAAKEALSELHRYPDGSGHRLKGPRPKRLTVGTIKLTLGSAPTVSLNSMARCGQKPTKEWFFTKNGSAVYPIAPLPCTATLVAVLGQTTATTSKPC